MQQVISASLLFTGEEWLKNHSVVINNGIIEQILPAAKGVSRHFEDCLLVPAFIDAQVYGAGGKLFSVYPQASTLALMHDIFLEQGTLLYQPTIATNTYAVFKSCIDAVREYWNKGGKGVHGLHLEGPWINAGKRGAHLKELVQPPVIKEVKDLLEYGKGVITMITLAPEVCQPAVLDIILNYNVIISAGHSNASYGQAKAAFDKGISAVTHLFNAMSPLHHREPGLTGAALHHTGVQASIIPDGHHVDYTVIALSKKLMEHRLFAITDAVTETSDGPYQHHLAGDKYECNGVLSGSALSMHKAFLNLVQKANISVEEALKMCSLYPARVLGCQDNYGRLAPNYAGTFLVLNDQLEIVSVIT